MLSPDHPISGRLACLLFPHCPEQCWAQSRYLIISFSWEKNPSIIFSYKWAEILLFRSFFSTPTLSFLKASVSISNGNGRLTGKKIILRIHFYARNACSLQPYEVSIVILILQIRIQRHKRVKQLVQIPPSSKFKSEGGFEVRQLGFRTWTFSPHLCLLLPSCPCPSSGNCTPGWKQ